MSTEKNFTHYIRRATETETDAIHFENFMACMFAENLPTLVSRGSTPTSEQVTGYISRHATGENAVFLAKIAHPEIDNNIMGSVIVDDERPTATEI